MNYGRKQNRWDVGHQAYGHKILTERRERFSTNRKLHGLKPFPSPSESEYDTFTCGHASNSISAALGMAVASANQDEKRRHIIAVIGDGSMSGGLAFEGLNNASSTPNDILIILNDNNMSIDRSVGGMNHYFHQLHTSSLYNRLRFAASRKLFNWGWLNEERRKQLIRFNNSLKSLISNQQNVFEGMNIRYFGPSDGHDVIELVHTLRVLKDMKGPKLFHIHTVKGKGFKPAEKAADIWHAPGKFDKETGERIQTDTSNAAAAVFAAGRGRRGGGHPDQLHPDFALGGADHAGLVPEAGGKGRGGVAGAHHRLCQRGGQCGHRVQSRGTGAGHGSKDVPHRRAGHRVRHAGGGGVRCGAVAAGGFYPIIRNSPAGYCSAAATV